MWSPFSRRRATHLPEPEPELFPHSSPEESESYRTGRRGEDGLPRSKGYCPHCSGVIRVDQVRPLIPAGGAILCPSCDGRGLTPSGKECSRCHGNCVLKPGEEV